ncbi:unnamed protein product [Periconia digitata]|uniref:Amine oxidase domain-containing protein n=1 Tax=Periconia digitata TaxID=1303443 RepID=A0A9W4U8C3_9PLEO|nr:unnamed protein product [Periconia digitata]
MASTERNVGSAKKTVAVVGSGLAGLATAHLLHSDRHQRYAVTVLECAANFSFDSASVAIRDESSKHIVERIDVPMRAFALGYYNNLIRMYKYLDIQYNRQRFIYTFSEKSTSAAPDPYFIHTSNNHRLPPIRPESANFVSWLFDIVYVAVCYLWWALCCFWVAPNPATRDRECESLEEYMRRIMLPRRFVQLYLLPLMASVATCTHTALLQFPAADLIEYKKRSAGQQHFTVTELDQVQKKLGAGIPVRFSTVVNKVEATPDSKVRILSSTSNGASRDETFDHVVLAVAPGIVGKIYQPLEKAMSQIPSTLVESVVQAGDARLRRQSTCPAPGHNAPHTLHFRTSATLAQTESIHVYPSGAMVTTCPFNDLSSAQNVLKSASFHRGLRTTRSRRVVNDMFDDHPTAASYAVDEKPSSWRNGDENVWVVGGWCWDGMVLLEGCVVSAMRVAESLGVHVPWRNQAI